jgi:hypothetical protein
MSILVDQRSDWVWNECDVPNPPNMRRDFTCVLWIYRSYSISRGCVSPLIGIEAEQCHERLQHATCISALVQWQATQNL